MKKKYVVFSLVFMLIFSVSVCFFPRNLNSASANSVTKNIWDLSSCKLTNFVNVPIDGFYEKNQDSVSFSVDTNGLGVSSNIYVVNGSSYSASCVFSVDNYQSITERFLFMVFCYDKLGNKLLDTNLVSGLPFDSFYGGYGLYSIDNNPSVKDFNFFTTFTIKSPNVYYISVKFGIYDLNNQSGCIVKYPMVTLGTGAIDYIPYDAGYSNGFTDGKMSIYNVLNPFSSIKRGVKYFPNTNQYIFTETESGYVTRDNWIVNPGGSKLGYYRSYSTSTYNSSGLIDWIYLVNDVDKIGSMTYDDFLASNYMSVYYLIDTKNLIEIKKVNFTDFEQSLKNSFDAGQKKGYKNGYDYGLSQVSDTVKKEGYNNGYYDGKNAGYDEGLAVGNSSLNLGLNSMSSLFNGLSSLLGIKVFGTVPLGAFLGIPLLFGLVMFILKLVRG